MNKRTLALGSLFDGAGGFPLGGMLAGVETVWSSEIEPFPVLVTHKRLPRVKHYGDVSELKGSELEPVDIITFGSPCQDLSVAGRRAGLQDGERSSLFFQAIRIIKEMREATDGKYPRYAIWENVPGAFSSNDGEDFKAVLEAFISVKKDGIAVPSPADHRWPHADVYLGDGWSVAYRVFDAQYWGVPQRRSRIFALADFDGASAPEVLFKSEGMSGYSAESFRAWQRTAVCAAESAGEAGERADAGDPPIVVNPQGCSGITITEDQTGTLVAQDHGHHPAVLYSAGFCTEHSAQSRSIGYEEEKSPTLRAGAVPGALALQHNPTDSRLKIDEKGIVQTLLGRAGTGGNQTPLVAEPAFGISKEAYCGGEKANFNFAVNEEVSPTLQAGGVGAVAKPEPINMKIKCGHGNGDHGALMQQDKSATLGCNSSQTHFQPVGFDRYNGGLTGDVAQTLTACAGTSGDNTPMVFQEIPKDEKACSISKEVSSSGQNANFNSVANKEMASPPQADDPGATARPEIKAFGVCSKSSYAMQSDNPKAGFYEAKTTRTLDQGGGNPSANQGGMAILSPDPQPSTYCATTGSFMAVSEEVSNPLLARDWKDAQVVNDAPNEEPMYIVRRLLPQECAMLQGFPANWCADLAIPDPSDNEIAFWKDVWDTWQKLNGLKPKTEKQIRKWLADPYSDSAEYKLWGNSLCASIAYFILAGIVWADEKEAAANPT